MKNIQLLTLILVILLSGCNNYKEQTEQLQISNQELTASLENCNSLLQEYQSTINDIDARLYRSLPDGGQPAQSENLQQLRTRVNNAITQIDSLLKTNEGREQALRSRAYREGSRAGRLQEEIDTLNQVLVVKDKNTEMNNQEIARLQGNIEDLNSEIEQLNNRISKARERAEMITDTLQYAYYTSGTEDELIERKIVEKTGGLFGIFGQVKRLNPQLDLDQLERIDRRDMRTFEVNAEAGDLLLVSPHPVGSYSLESTGEESSKIVINDAASFWKVSKYLVVVTD